MIFSKLINKRLSSAGWFCFFIVFSFSFSSCKKYLEKKSNSAQVVPTTLADLQAILDDNSTMSSVMSPGYGEASADDYFEPDAVYNALPETQRLAYIWSPFEYKYSNDWSKGYLAIYNANVCLEGVSKIDLSSNNEVQWSNVKGSALFYRAYNFLNLAWVFAKAYNENTSGEDKGIVLRLTSDFNVPSVRSSVEETYQRIIKDAMDAATLLPDNSLHSMRPSKTAAYGLLARTYLSLRKYDSALKYSSLSLQLNSQLMNFNNSSEVNTSGTPFKQFNRETVFYVEMITYFSLLNPNFGVIDSTLYSSFNSNDLRKSAYFLPSGNYYKFNGSYTGVATRFFSGIATDEMMLVKAECNARGGNKDAALDDLNTLLVSRWKTGTFIPFTASTAQDALGIILVERRKELLMRGLRWIDIKRLNLEGANITLKRVVNGQSYTLAPNDDRYALPLPIDLIQNSNLQQN